jgi:hypothetical protein
MRQVLFAISAGLGLACAGCADTYGPSQYAGVYPAPNYYYYYPDYSPSYPYGAPYYTAPFVGLGVGGVFFSERNRFHRHDFDHPHGFEPNHFAGSAGFQHAGPPSAGPMSLGAALHQAAPLRAPAPPAPHAPPAGPMSLGAAIQQAAPGHQ